LSGCTWISQTPSIVENWGGSGVSLGLAAGAGLALRRPRRPGPGLLLAAGVAIVSGGVVAVLLGGGLTWATGVWAMAVPPTAKAARPASAS
jgi:hypothetical protein